MKYAHVQLQTLLLECISGWAGSWGNVCVNLAKEFLSNHHFQAMGIDWF